MPSAHDTPNFGLHIKLVPKATAEQQLGCKVWVYPPGKMGDNKSLIHYRQCFMERKVFCDVLLNGMLHVGLGQVQSADIRVRFPSGVVKEIRGAQAKTTVVVTE